MRKLILKKRPFLILVAAVVALFIATATWYISTLHIDMLEPKGIIAIKQYDLLILTTLLGLLVVIPVFIMAIIIAWRYREGNTKAKYTPTVSTNRLAETIWWGIPVILITILSIITWTSTHDLDPHKPLASDVKPIKVQVVALDWKWLFIYPEHDIATVNMVQFPVDTPVNFEITADAPMNSFWIPQLGGQIYAMAGMTTKLHLNAIETGDYKGSSANISGEGFADMKFIARASSKSDFDTWIKHVKQSNTPLTMTSYAELAKKSKDAPISYYSTSDDDLYDTIVMKYMMPETIQNTDTSLESSDRMDHTEHMNHAEMESH
ncbi:MAG TPA: ubiquinol oxidase subunit II [Candidatus Saccharimonadales bacterium]|jgi:cytochrome o ubiquinol oxidase subunit 2|nr:ubiquinol oxidase subunit II [Candidatus Saccharimonadales bacterium]